MYDFIDRPVTALNRGGRLLVWAMRHWVRAVQAGRCPCGDLRPTFESRALGAAYPHFHGMMAVLNRYATEQMRFGAVDCARVSEHEALVISMVRAAHDEEKLQAGETAALIVGRPHCPYLLAPMVALAQALAATNRLPATPVFDPASTRFPNE